MSKIYLPLLVIAGLLLASCQGSQSQTEPTTVPTAVPTEAPVPSPTPEPTADAAGQGDLLAQPWQWIEFTNPVEQYAIDNPQSYLLVFKEDGTVEIKADCNNALGVYTTDGKSLKIQVGPMTRADCPPGSRSDKFVETLGYAAGYFFKDGHLFIDLFADGGTLEFEPSTEAPEADVPESLADSLGNLSYGGIFPDQPITLVDGFYSYDDGSSAKPFVRFIPHLIATGDLNGDGLEDAVVLLEDQSSGTGDFIYLAAVLDALGNPAPTEALMIGDRIGVKSLVMNGSQVVADLVAQGLGDAACCASWNVRRQFTLEDGRLVEKSSQDLSKISLADINGTSWKLVNLNGEQEPVLPDTEITLQIAEGQISGFTGCNDYSSTVSSGAFGLNSVVIGPISTTRKSCPEPVMNQETTYLTRLGNALQWRYDGGYLAVFYKLEGELFGELLFAPLGQ